MSDQPFRPEPGEPPAFIRDISIDPEPSEEMIMGWIEFAATLPDEPESMGVLMGKVFRDGVAHGANQGIPQALDAAIAAFGGGAYAEVDRI